MKEGNVSTKALKLSFMLDVFRGLKFMHSKKVAHRGMKPANILVDQDENGRLLCAFNDFAISQMFSENSQLVGAFKVVNLRGASIAYATPEVVTRLQTHGQVTMELTFTGDVYSFGMIAFNLWNTSDGWKQLIDINYAILELKLLLIRRCNKNSFNLKYLFVWVRYMRCRRCTQSTVPFKRPFHCANNSQTSTQTPKQQCLVPP